MFHDMAHGGTAYSAMINHSELERGKNRLHSSELGTVQDETWGKYLPTSVLNSWSVYRKVNSSFGRNLTAPGDIEIALVHFNRNGFSNYGTVENVRWNVEIFGTSSGSPRRNSQVVFDMSSAENLWKRKTSSSLL